jgi:hypothetical protein
MFLQGVLVKAILKLVDVPPEKLARLHELLEGELARYPVGFYFNAGKNSELNGV